MVDWPNFSATIVANGYTVDDPTIEIWSLACAAVDRARLAIMPAIQEMKRILFSYNQNPSNHPYGLIEVGFSDLVRQLNDSEVTVL